ncbi:MAG TPA: polymer-forming cytoskeletal protein [Casimicrobiaceae bacterium]|nr:polymer-forming cytoskeletal protein [Casimicrobiaceae bacterium]
MLNFNRRDGAPADPKEAGKFALKPALYEPPSGANASNAPASLRNPQPAPAAQRAEPAPQPVAAPAAAPAPVATPSAQPSAESGAVPGSKLHVGVNIKLKGVEISDCDNVVIEGQVEATVHSKVMQIEKPGTLKGTALIDIAEIHGDFTGEITARTRLVVHGTGRVSGTIRYGSLVVEDGGELSGDVKQLERPAAAAGAPAAARAPRAAA